MTGKGPPRRRRKGEVQALDWSAKRALLADIIASNRSVFEPGLNPDMDIIERDNMVDFIKSLEEWQASLGHGGPPPAAGELGWRASVLREEIRSWKSILRNAPAMPPEERSGLLQTVGELQRWRAELMAQKRAMEKRPATAAGRRGRGRRKQVVSRKPARLESPGLLGWKGASRNDPTGCYAPGGKE